jgi:RimJ/RimL family protein N-acetyltransferase
MRDVITSLEEVSLNAWPALQTILYDGWVLRFANGYTQRANSINPLFPSSIDFDEKLKYCEKLYRDKNLDVIFKITPEVRPANLDYLLGERGYRKDSYVSVQCLKLYPCPDVNNTGVTIEENMPEQWLESFCRINNLSEYQCITLKQMISNIIPMHCFASIISEGKIISCGLGVLQMGYLGLFDVITDEAYRQRGFGRMLIQNILNWGVKNSAHTAYLQVLRSNISAMHLYSKLGFSESYQFWFRVKQ